MNDLAGERFVPQQTQLAIKNESIWGIFALNADWLVHTELQLVDQSRFLGASNGGPSQQEKTK